MVDSSTQHSTNRTSWLKTYNSQNMSDLYSEITIRKVINTFGKLSDYIGPG